MKDIYQRGYFLAEWAWIEHAAVKKSHIFFFGGRTACVLRAFCILSKLFQRIGNLFFSLFCLTGDDFSINMWVLCSQVWDSDVCDQYPLDLSHWEWHDWPLNTHKILCCRYVAISKRHFFKDYLCNPFWATLPSSLLLTTFFLPLSSSLPLLSLCAPRFFIVISFTYAYLCGTCYLVVFLRYLIPEHPSI